MALFGGKDSGPKPSMPARRPSPGLLRRERRALLRAREERLRDLGGLMVEMYRRRAWREDILHERCAEVIGIDARLGEIDELLHGGEGTDRCSTCGAAVLVGSHFCPNCGALLDDGVVPGLEDTIVEPPE
jgi:hypothetical protein